MMDQEPAAQVLDAVAFVRAVLGNDLVAIERLLVDADPREMLLALSSLLVSTTPNLPDVLDHWRQAGLEQLGKDDPV